MTGESMVVMYSTSWCGYCLRLKTQMQRAGIAYTEINIEQDEDAARFVGSVNGGNHVVPTVVMPDGTAMTNPSIHEVLAAVTPAQPGSSGIR